MTQVWIDAFDALGRPQSVEIPGVSRVIAHGPRTAVAVPGCDKGCAGEMRLVRTSQPLQTSAQGHCSIWTFFECAVCGSTQEVRARVAPLM